jgi:hypothetical protein
MNCENADLHKVLMKLGTIFSVTLALSVRARVFPLFSRVKQVTWTEVFFFSRFASN